MARHFIFALLIGLVAFFELTSAQAQFGPPCCGDIMLPPCCQIPSAQLLPGLDLQARAFRGVRWYREGELHYQLRYNQAFMSLLVLQDWRTLAALEGMSDRQLCREPCSQASTDFRHLIEAAINWKTSREAGNWNSKLYLVAFIGVLVSIVSAIAAVLALDWFRFFNVRKKHDSLTTSHAVPVPVAPGRIAEEAEVDWRILLKQRLHALSINQRMR